ncbi:Inhibitor of growth protein 3 [Schistosoma japonicum]|nr:Inhibitor of growth protein 3 [Schistosoma japonicum]KAH8848761.1 Inhibitor of growth protein 3 [Schistosoma japonicum]
MLYFEDFMEAIENMPSELNESLTNVRQLDLQAQNILDSLSETIQAFFENCRLGRLLEYEKNTQILNITREYERALVYCKDKREIVENIYSTYRKLMRKLDVELEKFRLELEADNSGVTEQIEKRVQNVLGKALATTSKSERRRQRLRFQQSGHCKTSFSVRRRLVGPAFRAALKSACMRPAHMGGVQTLKSTNFSLDGDQTSFNNSSLISTSVCHAPETGFHRKNAIHADGLSPLKPIDENSLSLDHHSSDSSYDRTFDTINLQAGGVTKFEEDTANVHNSGAGFLSMKNNSSLPQEMPLDAKTHAGMHDPITKSANSSSHLFYDEIESNPTDREKLNLTPTTGSAESQMTEDMNSPGWPSLTQSFSNVREKRRYPRRFDRIGLTCDFVADELGKLDESPVSGIHSTLDHGFDEQTYEFSGNTKSENPVDQPDDDEDYKRYCVCRDVSYGDMIACDAPDCPFEWFHYACVNLTVAPKGRWFCPTCSKSLNTKKNIKKTSSRKQ